MNDPLDLPTITGDELRHRTKFYAACAAVDASGQPAIVHRRHGRPPPQHPACCVPLELWESGTAPDDEDISDVPAWSAIKRITSEILMPAYNQGRHTIVSRLDRSSALLWTVVFTPVDWVRDNLL